MKRRLFLQTLATTALALPLSGRAATAAERVVVVGGGFGGASFAKNLRLMGQGKIDVTLVEANPRYTSCPESNLVIAGYRAISEIQFDYQNLQQRYGIKLVTDRATAVDDVNKRLVVENGKPIPYDKLVLSPGIAFMWEQIEGMQDSVADTDIPHAWKAGPQTLLLRQQLQAMEDGGVVVINVPLLPFRCPPAPYERACLIAQYLSQHKKKSKILILDANDDVASKSAVFKQIWKDKYAGIIDYQANFTVAEVDVRNRTVISDFGDKVAAQVVNLIPPQRAGLIAHQAGVVNMNKRWCEVNFLNFASTQKPHIHILGDAIQIAPLMPKSAQMANQHAKVCATAIATELLGKTPSPPMDLYNACYSNTSASEAIHQLSSYQYSGDEQTYLMTPNSLKTSDTASTSDHLAAEEWAKTIWTDTFS